MSEPIEEILKKTVENMSKVNSPSSSNINPSTSRDYQLAGDPNCPHCGGLGYVRNELPVGHEDFGKIQVCVCRFEEISNRSRDLLYAHSQLNKLKALTFDNFEQRGRMGLGPIQADSVENAYNQAHHFASTHIGWLFLQGHYGTGKTHLAAAIANLAVELNIATIFITVPDLLDTLRYTYQIPGESFQERFEEVRKVDLLILDDFGTQNATSWAQEKLFQIINYRYINQLPLVVTTNLSLKEIEGRIRSRLQDPEIVTRVHIQSPDYRRPADDTGQHELSSLELHGKRTFGSFSMRKEENISADEKKNLSKMFKVAEKYAKKPAGWLVFTGGYGSGKTHLAASIANYQGELGSAPLFVMVPDLLDHLRATFNPNNPVSYDRRFDEIRTTPLLIMDDLGTQSMTPWVREKLYQLFNHRYHAELPTVITTADSLEEMDARIRSRMLDGRLCKIYAIKAPAFTGK
ncbi:MAG: ATP-binding protein [Chloroflexota bacterium]